MWHRLFPRFCGRFFFSAIRVRNRERIPASGPVLWLGLHRNGAVDGFVYAAALRRPLVFLISTQLRKNFLARIFFNGIAVARTNEEGDRAANRAALDRCIALLHRGGELAVFPEGTSSLGPRHLPFKAGAAQLVLDWLDAGRATPPLRVVPLGIHYERPWSFRSAVEVIVGEPIDIALPADLPTLGRLRELKRRITIALEAVGVDFADGESQQAAEALANVATTGCGTECSRFAVLKAAQRGECVAASAVLHEFEEATQKRRALTYHGVAATAPGVAIRELFVVTFLGPVVVAGVAANLGPWLGAWWAAKKFPDDANVIALWKILAGLPLLALWALTAVLLLIGFGGWRWALGYVALTGVAWAAYDCVKRDAVVLWNNIFHRSLRDPFERVIAQVRALR